MFCGPEFLLLMVLWVTFIALLGVTLGFYLGKRDR